MHSTLNPQLSTPTEVARIKVHAFSNDALGYSDLTELAQRLARTEVSTHELQLAAVNRMTSLQPILNGLAWSMADDIRNHVPYPHHSKGVFAGIPTLFKDNTPLAGIPCRYGSLAVPQQAATHTSAIAQQYLQLGLVPVGISRMPEFGFNASTEYADANAVHNPWHTDYSAGGSSGGAAALVAAGVVPLAHANDGGGSIRIPAACCGLVGLKPTRGRLVANEASKYLLVDVVCDGVLTRSVRDTAWFFAEAEKVYANKKLPAIGHVNSPLTRKLNFGLTTRMIAGTAASTAVVTAAEKTAALLASMGHNVEEVQLPFSAQFVEDFTAYWGMLAFTTQQLGRLIIDPQFHAHRLDALTVGMADYFSVRKYQLPRILRNLKKAKHQYDKVLSRYDVIVSPVTGSTAPKLGCLQPDQPFAQLLPALQHFAGFTPLHNITGHPALSLPVGLSDNGLPVGVQLGAAYGDERTLLETAYTLEEAFNFTAIYR